MKETSVPLHAPPPLLNAEGLKRFQGLQTAAVMAVTERFYTSHGSTYERFGQRGRDACREDLAFHLEFLRPVLEFGLLQPMVDYLRWLNEVLAAREVPTRHLALSLDWLAEFFTEQMPAEEGRIVAAALQSVRQALQSADEPPTVATAPEPWPDMPELEAALLRGDQRAAQAIMQRRMAAGHSLIEVEMHLIQPALYRIGEQWQANQVSVAQEHLASAIVQSLMTWGLVQSPPPEPNGKRILLACVEGNNHAMGLRMVADAFLLSGWEIQYLGANVPTPALVQQVRDWQPDLVGLSVSFPQQLKGVKEAIALMTAQIGAQRPPVIVGGLAINRFRQLTGVLGADASGLDAEAAVATATHLVGH